MTKWTIPDTPSPEALVKAALSQAADHMEFEREARSLLALASNPEAVAQIIKKAQEGRG